jgi:hypothetical protein
MKGNILGVLAGFVTSFLFSNSIPNARTQAHKKTRSIS